MTQLQPERSAGLQELREVLQGPVRRLFLATFINALGNGLTLTLFVVYLTQVRHIPVARATLLLSWMAVVGMAAAPVVGTLTDKFGPRRVLMVCSVGMAAAVFSYGRILTLRDAVIACTAVAVAGSGLWGPNTTMLAACAPAHLRQRAFGLSFMLLNLGIGVGGLVGTTIVDTARPESFELLYRLDALSFTGILLIQLTLKGYGGPSPKSPQAGDDRRGWAEVLRDRTLLRYLASALLLMVCGYGSIDVGLSYFATTEIGLPVNRLGVVLFVNTAAIVIAQLSVLRRIEGRSRTRLLAAVGLLWALSWVVNGLAVIPGTTGALVLLCLGQVFFALGETVWAPVAPAIVNDLAADDLRGRYNAAQSLLWTLAGTLSPMLAGVFLQRGAGLPWVGSLVIGCLLATVLFLGLRRRVSAHVDGRTASRT